MNGNGRQLTPGEPVYIQIEADLRAQIMGGKLNPGEMLPSESALMGLYGASRETVRRSLKELENRGLTYTRPGKGYFVAEPVHSVFKLNFADESAGFSQKLRRINVEEPSVEVCRRLELSEYSRVIRLSRVITKADEPVALDEKYLPYNKGIPLIENEIQFSVFSDIATLQAPPFAFYTKMEIVAENATQEVTRYLRCGEGEALLVVSRCLIGHDGRKLGYAKTFLSKKWGVLEAVSGYTSG